MAQAGFDPDTPTVKFRQLPHDGQPQPTAAIATRVTTVDLAEAFEDARVMFGGDANAFVLYREANHIWLHVNADPYPPATM